MKARDHKGRWFALALLVLGTCLAGPAVAAGADALCLACHDAGNWPGVHALLDGPHGVASDPRSPAGGAGCATCHEAGEHPRNPTVAPTPVEGACIACHRADALHWETSVHAAEDVQCSTCHDVHATRATVAREDQADGCYGCHRDVRMEANLPSRHPIREGLTTCSDCHAPHGSLERASLRGVNPNESCLDCHEAQRGPFLFDHPAASDDCGNCHVPHGSVHEPLLARRPPQLCQQCHLANFHPSDLVAGGGLPGARPDANLLGRNCLSCHPRVHGSNHPSGARLTR